MDAALSREDDHQSRLSSERQSSRQSYAISEWHDTDAVYDKLRRLIKQPMRPIRRESMDEVLRY
jgi:glutamate-1-semialdehyde 2,1-aminomutase